MEQACNNLQQQKSEYYQVSPSLDTETMSPGFLTGHGTHEKLVTKFDSQNPPVGNNSTQTPFKANPNRTMLFRTATIVCYIAVMYGQPVRSAVTALTTEENTLVSAPLAIPNPKFLRGLKGGDDDDGGDKPMKGGDDDDDNEKHAKKEKEEKVMTLKDDKVMKEKKDKKPKKEKGGDDDDGGMDVPKKEDKPDKGTKGEKDSSVPASNGDDDDGGMAEEKEPKGGKPKGKASTMPPVEAPKEKEGKKKEGDDDDASP